jgi:hypothetical protein
MGQRIDIETDNIAQLGSALRIAGQLKPAHPMPLQPVRGQMRCAELTLMPSAWGSTGNGRDGA